MQDSVDGLKLHRPHFAVVLFGFNGLLPPLLSSSFFRQLCSLLLFLPSVGRSQLTAEVAGRHPRRQQQNCPPIFLSKMELQTLFQRESVADPFFIRIIQIISSSVPIFIVAYPLFRTRIQTWRAGKPSWNF